MITLWPDVLRKSTMIKLFAKNRAPGWKRAIDEIEKVHRKFPSCLEHGPLPDPIVAVVGEGDAAQIAIVCPQCSDPMLREAWEAEANVS